MGFLHTSSSFLQSPSQFHLPSLQPHCHSRRITKLHSRTFHSNFTTITVPPPQPFPQIPKLSHTTTHLVHHRSHTNMPLTLHASPHNSHSTATATNSKLILITSSLTIALAVANRVLYKLALVPMKQYPFFLAQFTTFGYVAIYSSILYMRYWAGIVTDEMLALPKWRLMAISALEALGVATGMSTREDCLVARRNGNGRGKIDGDAKINRTHRERPCLGRRAVNPESISFLDSDSDYVSSRPGLEVFGTRYYRHARHPSPEGFAEGIMY